MSIKCQTKVFWSQFAKKRGNMNTDFYYKCMTAYKNLVNNKAEDISISFGEFCQIEAIKQGLEKLNITIWRRH